jgi:hypothetical protein
MKHLQHTWYSRKQWKVSRLVQCHIWQHIFIVIVILIEDLHAHARMGVITRLP